MLSEVGNKIENSSINRQLQAAFTVFNWPLGRPYHRH